MMRASHSHSTPPIAAERPSDHEVESITEPLMQCVDEGLAGVRLAVGVGSTVGIAESQGRHGG